MSPTTPLDYYEQMDFGNPEAVRCDHHLPVKYTRNFLVSRGIDEHKIFILPHVVDERFRPLAIKKDYDVIYVGRLDPAKHVETVIKSISIVKKTLPSIKVVIVGDGESQSDLEELTRS